MCRGPKNSPQYRRCLSSIVPSQGGTRGLSKTDAAKVKADIESGRVPDPRIVSDTADAPLDLADAMQRAEADEAAHQAWLTSKPTPLEIELARVGLSGLDQRYGIDHSRIFRRNALDTLDVPAAGPAPAHSKAAGEAEAITLTAPAAGKRWAPATGLTVTWRGPGNAADREKYVLDLGAWFTRVFDALLMRMKNA